MPEYQGYHIYIYIKVGMVHVNTCTVFPQLRYCQLTGRKESYDIPVVIQPEHV